MKTVTQSNRYRIQTQTGEVIVQAPSPFAALGIHRKRGPNGLGAGWTLTRQPDGWIVAANKSQRTLERATYRLKEEGWVRGNESL